MHCERDALYSTTSVSYTDDLTIIDTSRVIISSLTHGQRTDRSVSNGNSLNLLIINKLAACTERTDTQPARLQCVTCQSVTITVQYILTFFRQIRFQTEHTYSRTNKKGQLSLTNPRDACETFARFM